MIITLREQFNSSPDGEGDWIATIGEDRWTLDDWPSDTSIFPFHGLMSECPSTILDHTYNDGFGRPNGPPFTVWTDRYVGGVWIGYDGPISVEWVTRNPDGTGSCDGP